MIPAPSSTSTCQIGPITSESVKKNEWRGWYVTNVTNQKSFSNRCDVIDVNKVEDAAVKPSGLFHSLGKHNDRPNVVQL